MHICRHGSEPPLCCSQVTTLEWHTAVLIQPALAAWVKDRASSIIIGKLYAVLHRGIIGFIEISEMMMTSFFSYSGSNVIGALGARLLSSYWFVK